MQSEPRQLAPCGIYCGACPSIDKTCLGCASNSKGKGQKRKSKWACKVRKCCYEIERKQYCSSCEKFPCKIINKKLIESHPGDKRFKYRHEIPENFKKLEELGVKKYLKYQEKRWKCPSCNGRILMYYYECEECSKNNII